ncbi:MAG TPA: glycosyltransferase family 39 protein [Thermoanaerobaculia bacterium]|nr:glycosyltransferase family 39 protein [Thermoanaerobaculia bacterium]
MAPRPAAIRSGFRADLATAALALLILLPGASRPFWNRDEADYAAVARAMARGGSLAAPALFGKSFAEKPPLVFWLTAGSFRLFGESEAAGRLPHLVLAALAVALVRRLAARTGAPDRGGAAAAVFATSLLWIVYARLLLTEAALLFFDLAAIHALLSLSRRFRPAALAGAAGALAGALLAKGPVALAAPALFAAGSITGGRPRGRSILGFAAAAAIATALTAPWWLGRGSGTAAFLARENVGRFLRAREGHGGPFLYYVPVLVAGLFPWAGFAAGPRTAARRPDPRWEAWAWGIPVLFSFSATKLPHYVLPALPAFAMIASERLRESGEGARRTAAWVAAVTGVLLVGGAIAGTGRVEFPALLVPSIAALAVAAALALSLPSAARSTARFFTLAVLAAISIPLLLPAALEDGRALAVLGRAASRSRRPGEPAGGWRFDEVALDFYSGIAERRKWNDASVLGEAIAHSPSRSLLLWIRGRDAPPLARGGGIALAILASRANLVETGPQGEILLCRARFSAARR